VKKFNDFVNIVVVFNTQPFLISDVDAIMMFVYFFPLTLLKGAKTGN
jgi:hypothetical protein